MTRKQFSYLKLIGTVAVMQGCITQMRSLGGSIGLAVGTIVFNGKLRGSTVLEYALNQRQLLHIYKSPLYISLLTPGQQELVAQVVAETYTRQM